MPQHLFKHTSHGTLCHFIVVPLRWWTYTPAKFGIAYHNEATKCCAADANRLPCDTPANSVLEHSLRGGESGRDTSDSNDHCCRSAFNVKRLSCSSSAAQCATLSRAHRCAITCLGNAWPASKLRELPQVSQITCHQTSWPRLSITSLEAHR